MAYSAMVREVLISSPGDAADDARTVAAAIQQWSTTYGKGFGTVVVPLSWTQHAVAEFGRRPQESLNEQLVDRADAVIALLWHRLGSPTGQAESGTVEEVREAVKAGKDVALLVCDRPPGSLSDVDSEQLARRDEFLASIRSECLYLSYSDDVELRRHVDNVLSRLVTRDQQHLAFAAAAESAPVARAAVWPRVETRERVDTDSKGRLKTRRSWRLVIENTGDGPARKVEFRLEPEGDDSRERLPKVMHDGRPIEVLAPGGRAEYPLSVALGMSPQCRCIVTWEDDDGPHEQPATIRFT